MRPKVSFSLLLVLLVLIVLLAGCSGLDDASEFGSGETSNVSNSTESPEPPESDGFENRSGAAERNVTNSENSEARISDKERRETAREIIRILKEQRNASSELFRGWQNATVNQSQRTVVYHNGSTAPDPETERWGFKRLRPPKMRLHSRNHFWSSGSEETVILDLGDEIRAQIIVRNSPYQEYLSFEEVRVMTNTVSDRNVTRLLNAVHDTETIKNEEFGKSLETKYDACGESDTGSELRMTYVDEDGREVTYETKCEPQAGLVFNVSTEDSAWGVKDTDAKRRLIDAHHRVVMDATEDATVVTARGEVRRRSFNQCIEFVDQLRAIFQSESATVPDCSHILDPGRNVSFPRVATGG